MDTAVMSLTPPTDTEPWWTYTARSREGEPSFTVTLRFLQFAEPPELVLWRAEVAYPDPREKHEVRGRPESIPLAELAGYEKAARRALELFGLKPEREPRTKRELTPEFLAKVVERHRELADEGPAPTKRLALEHDVAATTAKSWLQRAKREGIKVPS